MKQTYNLQEVMDILLSEEGCPWDKSQTLESLRQYLLEEVYELLESMDDPVKHKEELGDLLFQIVFQSAIREREGLFSFKDVERGIARKLIDRHPQIFEEQSGGKTTSSEFDNQINEKMWERQKRKQKDLSSFMDDIPINFPALLRADKIQRRAAAAGFDWKDDEGPKAKITEEMKEFEEAVAEGDEVHIKEEFGDILFALVNYGRHLGINAETALFETNLKFQKRFRKMEKLALEKGTPLETLDLDEQEKLWIEAKNFYKNQ